MTVFNITKGGDDGMSDVQVVVLAIIKMAKIFGCYTLIAVVVILTIMAILKQCFGISTKKLVYGFLKSKK